MIRNIEELAEECTTWTPESSRDAEKAVASAVYKHTTCGCCFSADGSGVAVSGYVEGVDIELPTHRIEFPFELAAFDLQLERCDEEAEEIWNQTHGCEDCGPEDPTTGHVWINPNCPSCKGEGVIL